MAVTATSSTPNATGSLTGGNKAAQNVDFNTFLKLLVTQLKNQDPLNPKDGTEFTSQIATFSQLEQQMASNSHLKSLAAKNEYTAQALAVSYIGKEALAPGETMTVANKGDGVKFGYELDKAAYSVKIEIRDADGKLVRELSGKGAKGRHPMAWDGKNADGVAVDAGKYKVSLTAFSKDGKKVISQPYVYSTVKSVEVNGTNVNLELSGSSKVVKLDQVMVVR